MGSATSTPPGCCETCGRPFLEAPTAGPVDHDDVAAMRAACGMLGIHLSWDGHVGEADAARLVRRSPSTLRNRRAIDQPIPFRKVGGRVEYALSDLAAWAKKAGG